MLKVLMRNSLKREFNAKINFFIRLVTDIVWYSCSMLFFEVIYATTIGIGDWSIEQIHLFLGVSFVVDSLHMSFFYFNTMQLPYLVRMGEIDRILLYPIDSFVYASVQNIDFSSFISGVFGVWLIVKSLIDMKINVSLLRIIIFIVLILCGVLTMKSILFIIGELTFFLGNTEHLLEIVFDIFQFGMKPECIYDERTKRGITYIIPLLLIANFPSKFICSNLDVFEVIWSVTVMSCLLLLSKILWKVGLIHYSGTTM